MLKQSTSVQIKNIAKSFETHSALKNISFEINKGQFTTLLGPSGCGKTTLLRIIAGFEQQNTGDILFDGENINTTPTWERNIGFVFQNYALWPHMNVYENIAYGLKLHGLNKHAAKQRVFETLDMVGLMDRYQSYPGQLSGGQQQRIAIARALALRPDVLLMDEPLSNLDAKMRIDMRKDLLKLQRDIGITTIYVTHDQEEALEMSDTIAVMNNGVIEQIGPPEEIYSKPKTAFVASFIGHVTLLAGHLENSYFQSDLNFITPLLLDDLYNGLIEHNFHSDSLSKDIQLVLRPENISFTNKDDAHLKGKLINTTYQGRTYTSQVLLENSTICLVEHRIKINHPIKEEVYIKINDFGLVPKFNHYCN